jgi:hypothetical protein
MASKRAGAGAEVAAPQYSVLLPTYNERENLPIVLWLINRAFQDAYAHAHTHTETNTHTHRESGRAGGTHARAC